MSNKREIVNQEKIVEQFAAVILERPTIVKQKSFRKTTLKKQLSPLRYPGGKSKMIDQLLPYIHNKSNFVEAFCGGASLGLSLLEAGKIEKLILNDLDLNVYTFWKVVCSNQYQELIHLVQNYQPDRETYFLYRKWLLESRALTDIERAFYFLVINRCSFSGIQMANPKTNMQERWIPETLIKRIEKIHTMQNQIEIRNENAMKLIEELYWNKDCCIFIDPPYISKGDCLYPVKFHLHKELATLITDLLREFPGCADILITYDDQEILHELYDQEHIDLQVIGRRYSCTNL